MEVKNEHSKFLSSVVKANKEAFLEYDETKNPLDSFLWKLNRFDSRFSSLWTVTQMILVLSHGQATVKRGFSENKILLVENLNMESLIAQQLICNFRKQKEYEPFPSFQVLNMFNAKEKLKTFPKMPMTTYPIMAGLLEKCRGRDISS